MQHLLPSKPQRVLVQQIEHDPLNTPHGLSLSRAQSWDEVEGLDLLRAERLPQSFVISIMQVVWVSRPWAVCLLSDRAWRFVDVHTIHYSLDHIQSHASLSQQTYRLKYFGLFTASNGYPIFFKADNKGNERNSVFIEGIQKVCMCIYNTHRTRNENTVGDFSQTLFVRF